MEPVGPPAICIFSFVGELTLGGWFGWNPGRLAGTTVLASKQLEAAQATLPSRQEAARGATGPSQRVTARKSEVRGQKWGFQWKQGKDEEEGDGGVSVKRGVGASPWRRWRPKELRRQTGRQILAAAGEQQ